MPPPKAPREPNPVNSNANKDSVHSETVKKELRHHKLYEHYFLSPSRVKDLIFSKKPTGDPESKMDVDGEEVQDEEYTKVLEKAALMPKQIHPMPITTSMHIGWDTEVLMRNTDRRFHFPRVVSDVSKIGEMLGVNQNKKKAEKKP